MKKLLTMAVVIAIPLLVLIAVSAPLASANAGPHGGYNALTDACAGCHRAHSAPAARLLIADDPALCLSCHGAAGVGANTNVQRGLFDNSWASTSGLGTLNEPLHGGGFVSWQWNYSDTATYTDVTSVHNASGAFGPANAIGSWGLLTTTGSITGTRGVRGAAIPGGFRCTACHNPHGSTNWRILNTTINGMTVTVTSQGNITDEVGIRYTGLDIKYGKGISSFCAACHPAYHRLTAAADPTSQGNPLYGAYAHRSERSTGKATYLETTGWKSPSDTGGPYTIPMADLTGAGNNNGFTCLTCHSVHGTSASMTGWATPAGASYPIPSNDSALLRLPNRGVCEVCHQK